MADRGKFLVLRNTPFNLRILSFTLFTSSSGSGWLHPRLAYDLATDASRSLSRIASTATMASCVLSAWASSPSFRSDRLRDSAASFSAWEVTGGCWCLRRRGVVGGEVWVPTSREKSSVGSSQEEASSLSWGAVVTGMVETVDSSFERREVRWVDVVVERSWRALVCEAREGSM